MVVLIMFTGIFFTLLGKSIEKAIINPLTVFSLMFTLISFGAYLQLFGLYGADEATYAIIFVGMLLFGIGYTISTNVVFKRKTSPIAKNSLANGGYVIRYKLLYVFSIIALVYLIGDAVIAISYLLRGYSLKYIRFSLYGYSESDYYSQSTISYSLRYYVIQPITSLLPIMCIVDMFYGKKNKVLLISSIFIFGLSIITSGGRLPVLYLITNIFALFSILDRRLQFSSKVKRRIILLYFILLSLILFITFQRDIIDVMSNYYKYFVGCVPHLQLYMDKLNATDYMSYGASTFKSPVQLFLLALRLLRIIPDYPEWFYRLAEFTDISKTVYIGSGYDMRYNGFVTVFYYFFLDFGYFSVAFFSLVFGFIARKVYFNAKYYTNVRNLAILCILFQIIVVSFARFELSIPRYFITLILLFFCCKKVTEYE